MSANIPVENIYLSPTIKSEDIENLSASYHL